MKRMCLVLISLSSLAFGQGGVSASIGDLQGRPGSAARTVEAKLREVPSILDFGADPTGNTAADSALQALIAAVAASGYAGHINGGTYKLFSASNTKALTGNTRLYCDGPGSTHLVENSSNANTFAVTGRYNGIAHCNIIPARGTTGGTAILEGGSKITSGDSTYDDLLIENLAATGFFKYGIEGIDSAGFDDDSSIVMNSQIVCMTACVFLNNTQGAQNAVNAWQVRGNYFQNTGSGAGIVCDGCGESVFTDDGGDDMHVGVAFVSTTVGAGPGNIVKGWTGEGWTFFVTLDASSRSNVIELPYPYYPNTSPAYTDASGGKNAVTVWGGSHTEDMGPTGRYGRFCFGLCNLGGGAATQQANTQIEFRPDWTTSNTIKYPSLFCAATANSNGNCGLFNFQPGASGAGWVFSTLAGYTQSVVATLDNGSSGQTASLAHFTYGGTNNLGYAGMVSGTYPVQGYFSIQPHDRSNTMVTTSGATVVWSSGADFSGVQPGNGVMIGNLGSQNYYTVASVTSSTVLLLNASAGTSQSAVQFQASETVKMLSDGGITLAGKNLKRPVCDTNHEGTLWYLRTGNTDHLYFCAAVSSALRWRTIF